MSFLHFYGSCYTLQHFLVGLIDRSTILDSCGVSMFS